MTCRNPVLRYQWGRSGVDGIASLSAGGRIARHEGPLAMARTQLGIDAAPHMYIRFVGRRPSPVYPGGPVPLRYLPQNCRQGGNSARSTSQPTGLPGLRLPSGRTPPCSRRHAPRCREHRERYWLSFDPARTERPPNPHGPDLDTPPQEQQ